MQLKSFVSGITFVFLFNSLFLLILFALFFFSVQSYFAEVRQLEPQRTELMEIYSTVLWHLHAEVQLSTLAQDLVSQDRNSAAAWCATGNLFSAQTEHETAIKFFQRAIQVLYAFIFVVA